MTEALHDMTRVQLEAAVGGDITPSPAASQSGNSTHKTESWPEPLKAAAFHGLAGELVQTIEPHTESDPAAILLQFLAAFGNIIERGPHYLVEGDRHATNLFTLLVGRTAKGRKGTSWSRVRQVFEILAEPEPGRAGDPWITDRVQSGLSSGEGLIWAVRDPITKPDKNGNEEVVDEGVADKRLLIMASEFASVLRVLGRDGNTLSAIIRDAWDRGNLQSMTKTNQAVATGALISIVGHITDDELRRYLDRTETGNGFANRFLFIAVKRSKCLPDGGNLHPDALKPYVDRLAQAIEFARGVDRVTMDADAREIWHRVYPTLSEGLTGMLGAVTSRAEAQVIRLALLYALLDRSEQIGAVHLKAALAIWDYAEASARYVFGSDLGDPVADEILRALRASPSGMTQTELSALFKRHKAAQELGRALDLLQRKKLVRSETTKTEGRSATVWKAT